jgi:hypothetical protein
MVRDHRLRITEPAARHILPAHQLDSLFGIVSANQNFDHQFTLGSHFISRITSAPRWRRRAVFVKSERLSSRRNRIFSTGDIARTVRIIASPSCSVVMPGALCFAIRCAGASFSAAVIRFPEFFQPVSDNHLVLPPVGILERATVS